MEKGLSRKAANSAKMAPSNGYIERYLAGCRDCRRHLDAFSKDSYTAASSGARSARAESQRSERLKNGGIFDNASFEDSVVAWENSPTCSTGDGSNQCDVSEVTRSRDNRIAKDDSGTSQEHDVGSFYDYDGDIDLGLYNGTANQASLFETHNDNEIAFKIINVGGAMSTPRRIRLVLKDSHTGIQIHSPNSAWTDDSSDTSGWVSSTQSSSGSPDSDFSTHDERRLGSDVFTVSTDDNCDEMDHVSALLKRGSTVSRAGTSNSILGKEFFCSCTHAREGGKEIVESPSTESSDSLAISSYKSKPEEKIWRGDSHASPNKKCDNILSKMSKMFGPTWTEASLDVVLRYNKGSPKDSIKMILMHSDRHPYELVSRIQAVTAMQGRVCHTDEETETFDEIYSRELPLSREIQEENPLLHCPLNWPYAASQSLSSHHRYRPPTFSGKGGGGEPGQGNYKHKKDMLMTENKATPHKNVVGVFINCGIPFCLRKEGAKIFRSNNTLCREVHKGSAAGMSGHQLNDIKNSWAQLMPEHTSLSSFTASIISGEKMKLENQVKKGINESNIFQNLHSKDHYQTRAIECDSNLVQTDTLRHLNGQFRKSSQTRFKLITSCSTAWNVIQWTKQKGYLPTEDSHSSFHPGPKNKGNNEHLLSVAFLAPFQNKKYHNGGTGLRNRLKTCSLWRVGLAKEYIKNCDDTTKTSLPKAGYEERGLLRQRYHDLRQWKEVQQTGERPKTIYGLSNHNKAV